MAIKHFGSCTKNKPISNDKVTSGHLRHSLPGVYQVPVWAPQSALSCCACSSNSPWAASGGSLTLTRGHFQQYLLQLLFFLRSPSEAT